MHSMQFSVIQKEDADIPEQGHRNVFDLKSRLLIDGALFTGSIAYRPAPLYRSQFSLQRERVCLFGQAYGPTFDELIQILEALRVLNGKAVE
jgi:hypothetical protein